MAAQLAATVYVQDPDSHQTAELAAGSSPEPRLAALVTNPAAWVDGKLPRLPKAKDNPEAGGEQNPADGQDVASGDASATTSDGADPATSEPAAKKTAARKPARGRNAADEGTGGN